MKRYTPFSTRLSGSAGKKRLRPALPLFILVLVVVLGCGSLTACQSRHDPEEPQSGSLEPAPEAKTYDFEETVFFYGEQEYDLADRVGPINSITDAVPVGKHIVVTCHVGPKNGVYCIFDTESESFVSDLVGNNLIWYQDDIETSVYSFWSDIYAYDGSLVKSYDLPEDAMIRDLAFSSDHTELTVTILYADGTEAVDVIAL